MSRHRYLRAPQGWQEKRQPQKHRQTYDQLQNNESFEITTKPVLRLPRTSRKQSQRADWCPNTAHTKRQPKPFETRACTGERQK
jgi:hypothetical protein